MTFKPTVYPEGDSIYGPAALRSPQVAPSSPAHRGRIAGLPGRVWLLIATVSLVLAVGSSAVLYRTLGERDKDQVVLALESVPLFLRTTARLTWQSIVSAGSPGEPQRTAADEQAIHVAPLGLLDDKAGFAPLETYADFVPRKEELPMAAVAPPRLLDPQWSVSFNGTPRD